MPIHDQGYRRYGGERGQRRGWWVIASTTIRAQIRRRRVIALLLVAWLPFLVRAVLLYAAANFQQASFLAATPQVFREFLGWQSIFVFFVTILIDMISDPDPGKSERAMEAMLRMKKIDIEKLERAVAG